MRPKPARAAATLIGLLDCEPERSKAARAAAERFRRDFDAEIIGLQLRSFLMDGARTKPL